MSQALTSQNRNDSIFLRKTFFRVGHSLTSPLTPAVLNRHSKAKKYRNLQAKKLQNSHTQPSRLILALILCAFSFAVVFNATGWSDRELR